MTERSGDTWSEADVARLADLFFKTPRAPIAAIAAELGRSTKATYTEISRQGMAKPGAKLRKCIGVECYGERKFFSSGKGQNLCPRCRSLEIYRYAS